MEQLVTTPEGSDRIKDQGSEGIGGEREGREAAPRPAPHDALTPIVFKTPAPVTSALDRAPRLGAVSRLRLPEWWQAELRANPGVDLATEVLKAEAYLVAHPERHYRHLDRFLHRWLGHAEREA